MAVTLTMVTMTAMDMKITRMIADVCCLCQKMMSLRMKISRAVC